MKIMAYIIVALFLVVAGLAVALHQTTKMQSTKIANLKTDLVAAQETLRQVEQSVAISDKIIQSMGGNLSKIGEKGSIIGERVSMLERNNVQVRDLLATALPADGCLLDDSCPNKVPAP